MLGISVAPGYSATAAGIHRGSASPFNPLDTASTTNHRLVKLATSHQPLPEKMANV